VEDVANLLEEVGSPRIKMLFDVYHTQVEEGNVVEVIRQFHGFFGHVHIADVPGRHEPGTGEINYSRIVKAFREAGYQGVIGLEAFPETDDFQAMARFREVFS
jgi:hydroxypyruvate isomerase